MSEASLWSVATSPEGKPYYYHTVTKETTWEKPDVLKTALERAEEACDWKQFETPEGKPYYHNKKTNQTVWEMPPEFKAVIDAKQPTPNQPETNIQPIAQQQQPQQPQQQQPPVSNNVENTVAITNPEQQESTNDENAAQNVVEQPAALPILGKIPDDAPEPTDPVEVFKRLLNDAGVPGHAIWETALRAVVADPRYGVINSIEQKKRIFYDYLKEQRERERRDYIARKQVVQDAFLGLLRKRKDIGPDASQVNEWRQVSVMLQDEPEYKAVEDEDERKFFFEQYLQEVVDERRQQEDSARQAIIDSLRDAFIQLAYTDANQESPAPGDEEPPKREERDDEQLATRDIMQELKEDLARIEPPIVPAFRDAAERVSVKDFDTLNWHEKLTAHNAAVKILEQRHAAWRRRHREAKRELERRNRVAFRELLEEKAKNGELTADSQWPTFQPLIENDERFKAMQGQPGSQAQELFDDMIEYEKDSFAREASRYRAEYRDLTKIEPSLIAKPTDTIETLMQRLQNVNKLPDFEKCLKRSQHLNMALQDIIARAISDAEYDLKRAIRKLPRDTKPEDALKDESVAALALAVGDVARARAVVESVFSHKRRSRSRSRSEDSSGSTSEDHKKKRKHKHKSRRKHYDSDSGSERRHSSKKHRSSSSRRR